VHVAYADAITYAEWAHKSLATEAESKRAARGGLDAALFARADEFASGGATNHTNEHTSGVTVS
jgi:sulfatase modifying factor 1